MTIGFDAKRLCNNFTGLGNYSRFVVGALYESFPDNRYLLYTPKVKSTPDTNYFLQHFEVKRPAGIYALARSYWRSVSLANVALHDGVQLFHGLSNELPSAKAKDLRTVVTIHDVIFRRYPQFYKPIDRLIYDWKFKNACSRADAIVCVSQQTAKDAVEFLGADEKKISVIYQGCHPMFSASYTAEQVEAVRKKYDLPAQFILYVGTIEWRKNALLLLKAAAVCKEKLPVVMVGRKTNYATVLHQFVRAHGMEHQVKFIDHASLHDLPLIYKAANIFVYPSLFEGFGIPIVEAITVGLPVITSTGSCLSEAGGPDCWYVDPHNDEQLAATMDSVLRGTVSTKTSIEKSMKYIQRFQPPKIAQDLMSVYTSLV